MSAETDQFAADIVAIERDFETMTFNGVALPGRLDTTTVGNRIEIGGLVRELTGSFWVRSTELSGLTRQPVVGDAVTILGKPAEIFSKNIPSDQVDVEFVLISAD